MMRVKIACWSDKGVAEVEKTISSEGVPVAGYVFLRGKKVYYEDAWLLAVVHLSKCAQCRSLNGFQTEDVDNLRKEIFVVILEFMSKQIWEWAEDLEAGMKIRLAADPRWVEQTEKN